MIQASLNKSRAPPYQTSRGEIHAGHKRRRHPQRTLSALNENSGPRVGDFVFLTNQTRHPCNQQEGTMQKYEDLSSEQQATVHRIIQQTWNYIVNDVMVCRQEAGEDGPIPQDEVHEVTLDADRPRINHPKEMKDPQIDEFFGHSPGQYEEQLKAAVIALPEKDWC